MSIYSHILGGKNKALTNLTLTTTIITTTRTTTK